MNFHNPIDDIDHEELLEICKVRGIVEDDATFDDHEYWQLAQWLKEDREEEAAQDHFASFYSY